MKINSNKGRNSWLEEQGGVKAEVVKEVDSKLEVLSQIPVLAPWLNVELTDPTLNAEENIIFKERLQKHIVSKIYKLYLPLSRQFTSRNTSAVMSINANRVRMESQLLVKVKQAVKVGELANAVRLQLRREAIQTREQMDKEGCTMSVLIKTIRARNDAKNSNSKVSETNAAVPPVSSASDTSTKMQCFKSKGVKLIQAALTNGRLKLTDDEISKLFEVKYVPDRKPLVINYKNETQSTLRHLLEQKGEVIDPKAYFYKPVPPTEKKSTMPKDDTSQQKQQNQGIKRRVRSTSPRKRYLSAKNDQLSQYSFEYQI